MLSNGGANHSDLMVGEIHTGLLQNSAELTSEAAVELLALIPQHRVRLWERPIRRAASPSVLTGVDCNLPTRSGAKVRGIGTVAAEAWITSGHLLQSSTSVRITPAAECRRRSWSYYLARPGALEFLGEIRTDDVISGFLGDRRPSEALDLGAIADRTMSQVQHSRLLDHKPPFRSARTRLRWTAITPRGAEDDETVQFCLAGAGLRTLSFATTASTWARLPELGLDVARHDWLLSALTDVIDKARTGRREKADVVHRLRPAVDHLLHAWMPAAHLPDDLLAFWQEIEHCSGFSRQWDAAVRRIRDQMALAATDYLVGANASVSASVSASRTGPLDRVELPR